MHLGANLDHVDWVVVSIGARLRHNVIRIFPSLKTFAVKMGFLYSTLIFEKRVEKKVEEKKKVSVEYRKPRK